MEADDENDGLRAVTKRLLELLPRGKRTSDAEQLERLRRARVIWAETRDPVEVVRALGWARKRGQRYEPVEVLYIYRRMVEPGPKLFLEVPRGGDTGHRILPPIDPVDAIELLREHFDMQSVESARENVARYAKQLGVQVALPPKRWG